MDYLFHVESAKTIIIKKILQPLPLGIEWWLPYIFTIWIKAYSNLACLTLISANKKAENG